MQEISVDLDELSIMARGWSSVADSIGGATPVMTSGLWGVAVLADAAADYMTHAASAHRHGADAVRAVGSSVVAVAADVEAAERARHSILTKFEQALR